MVVCLRLKTKAERKIYAGCAKATNHYLQQVSGLKVRRPPSTLLSPTGWQHRRPRPEEPNKAEAVDSFYGNSIMRVSGTDETPEENMSLVCWRGEK